jgi:capsular polysaccharide biosynthesis protein
MITRHHTGTWDCRLLWRGSVDLVTVMRIVARRWMVVIPIIGLTALVAIQVDRGVEPMYQAHGSILIATPETNPRADYEGAVDAGALAERVAEGAALAALAADAPESEIRVARRAENLLEASATSTDEVSAEGMTDAAVELIVSEVEAVQDEAGVAEPDRIVARPLRPSVQAIELEEDTDGILYVSTVGVVLDPPQGVLENPFEASPVTGRMIEVSVQSDAGRERVASRAGGPIGFSVSQDPQDRAPILSVVTYGSSREQAVAAFDDVVATIDEDLDERQARAGVSPHRRLVIDVLAEPQFARDASPPVARAAVVTVALGIVIALAVAVITESIMSYSARTKRRDVTSSLASDARWPEPGSAGGTQADEFREPARTRSAAGRIPPSES